MLRLLLILMLLATGSAQPFDPPPVVAAEVMVLTRRGDEQLAGGLASDAVASYLEALERDRWHADAAFGLGLAYLQLAALAESLYAFDQLLALDAQRFEGHFNRALVLARLGRHAEAAAGFERALTIETDTDRRRAAWLALGTQHWWAQQPSAAADAFAEALLLGDRDVELELQRARALIEAGRLGEALVELSASPARATDPRFERWLAEAYRRDQRPEEALAAYRRALELEPESVPLRLAIAAFEERAARPTAVLDVLATLTNLEAGVISDADAALWVGLVGRAHYSQGALVEAETWFGRWVELASEEAAAWQWWGVTLYQLAAYEAAVEAFQAALRHAPSDVAVWRNLAAAYTAVERFDDAEGWYRRLLEREANDPQALYHLGWLRAAAGLDVEARPLWARACELGYAPACEVP